MPRIKRYKHRVAVLDDGSLQGQCLENNEPCWAGSEWPQTDGVAAAHAAANVEVNRHVEETGHVQANNRHGKR